MDTTPPAADWAGTSLASNAKALNVGEPGIAVLQYILHLTDEESGLRVAEPVVDSLELRDADGEVGVKTLPAEQQETAGTAGTPLYDVNFAVDGVGYYTYTARAQDMAGNLSEEISRVAVHDDIAPVAALIFARVNASKYDKTLIAADNLSVRDYSMVVRANNLPSGWGSGWTTRWSIPTTVP